MPCCKQYILHSSLDGSPPPHKTTIKVLTQRGYVYPANTLFDPTEATHPGSASALTCCALTTPHHTASVTYTRSSHLRMNVQILVNHFLSFSLLIVVLLGLLGIPLHLEDIPLHLERIHLEVGDIRWDQHHHLAKLLLLLASILLLSQDMPRLHQDMPRPLLGMLRLPQGMDLPHRIQVNQHQGMEPRLSRPLLLKPYPLRSHLLQVHHHKVERSSFAPRCTIK